MDFIIASKSLSTRFTPLTLVRPIFPRDDSIFGLFGGTNLHVTFFKSSLTFTAPYIKAQRNSLSSFPLRTFLYHNQLNERYALA